MKSIKDLKSQVQLNCDIVDARFADNFTLCIYLIKMREFYRWIEGISLIEDIENKKIIKWMHEQESYWETILDRDYEKYSIGGNLVEPFDNPAINQYSETLGYAYSSGYGYAGRPSFFLGKIEEIRELEDFKIIISGKEISRGMIAPPAMLQNKQIFIRKEALSFLIWAKIEEWLFRKKDNPMAKTLSFYDFESDQLKAIQRMTDLETETLILHELGEGMMQRILGHQWQEMMVELPQSKAEIIARAVRDLAADCVFTLPNLIAQKNEPALYFFYANFSGMRPELFPLLKESFSNWDENKNYGELARVVDRGRDYWTEMALSILNNSHETIVELKARIDNIFNKERLTAFS